MRGGRGIGGLFAALVGMLGAKVRTEAERQVQVDLPRVVPMGAGYDVQRSKRRNAGARQKPGTKPKKALRKRRFLPTGSSACLRVREAEARHARAVVVP